MAAVGGRPPAVYPLDQVGDHHVGVELGIAGPAGPVPEGGPDEPVGFGEGLAIGSSPGKGGLLPQLVEYGDHGPVVSLGDLGTDLVGAEGPQQ